MKLYLTPKKNGSVVVCGDEEIGGVAKLTYNNRFKPDDVSIMTVLGSLEDAKKFRTSSAIFYTALEYDLFSKFDRPLDTLNERDVSGWPISIVKPGLRYFLRAWRENGEKEDFVAITGIGKERGDGGSTLNTFCSKYIGGIGEGGTVRVRRGSGKELS